MMWDGMDGMTNSGDLPDQSNLEGAKNTVESFEVHGMVKWFDPVKGFGFVVADSGGPDILLHVNVLRNFGQSSVADGARVLLDAHKTERGVQAIAIRVIDPPEGTHVSELEDISFVGTEKLDTIPLQPARVKWFDKGKGFGFANAYGSRDDIFLHIEVLRQSGLADLQPGEAVAVRVIQGKRGYLAAEVKAWESVELDDAQD